MHDAQHTSNNSLDGAVVETANTESKRIDCNGQQLARIIDGRAAAKAMLALLKSDIETLNPKLAILQVGEHGPSTSFIRQKLKACLEVGMRHEHRQLPETCTEADLFRTIDEFNEEKDVSGFIVQLPLPRHLASRRARVLDSIAPAKDVDGFGSSHLGKVFLSTKHEHLPPATPGGIVALLAHEHIDVKGRDVVIVGASNVVGKPLAVMLTNREATVTLCHKETKKLAEHTRHGEILVVAAGQPNLIIKDMVMPGAVVIDVGINTTPEGLKGDVDFGGVREVASAITPVPGGVGPMTVAQLLKNCVTAKKMQNMGL